MVLDPLADLLPEEPPPRPPSLVDAAAELWDRLDATEPWRTRAACRDHDPALWFPGRGQKAARALEVCEACPVRDECLESTLREEADLPVWDVQGIRGGLRASERRKRRCVRQPAYDPDDEVTP